MGDGVSILRNAGNMMVNGVGGSLKALKRARIVPKKFSCAGFLSWLRKTTME